jgi:hypothetical protein
MIAWYSLLSEIVTISSVNGTFQEHLKLGNIMKHSGRAFISAKIFSGTKQYSFHLCNWTHLVRPTQGSWSKWLLQSHYKLVMANWTRNITHTQTHPPPPHTKWWYPNCYLVNEFLNFYLLNNQVEQDQKSLNTKTSWSTPSIPTALMRDFDSRSHMHA